MTLFFTGRNRDAALYLLHETQLDDHIQLSRCLSDTGKLLTASTDGLDDWGWSAGEAVMVDLLRALAGERTFDLVALTRGKADAAFTTAAVLAIGIACGVVVPPVVVAGEAS